MNDMMQVFCYNDKEVRTLDQNGEPWWVLADVCEALDLHSPHKVSERLDDDEKGRTFIPTLGGEQEVTIINEPGLYTVILRSNKPEAKPFKRWITHEVLPAIRRTGRYDTGENAEGMNPEHAELLELLAKEVQRLSEKIDSLSERRVAMTPQRSAVLADNARKRKWMRVFNAKLDLLEEESGENRNRLLHDLYRRVEESTGLIIDNERYRAIETYGLEDCSGVEAIYYNDALRKAAALILD